MPTVYNSFDLFKKPKTSPAPKTAQKEPAQIPKSLAKPNKPNFEELNKQYIQRQNFYVTYLFSNRIRHFVDRVPIVSRSINTIRSKLQDKELRNAYSGEVMPAVNV